MTRFISCLFLIWIIKNCNRNLRCCLTYLFIKYHQSNPIYSVIITLWVTFIQHFFWPFRDILGQYFSLLLAWYKLMAYVKFVSHFILWESSGKWWRNYQEYGGSRIVTYFVMLSDISMPQHYQRLPTPITRFFFLHRIIYYSIHLIHLILTHMVSSWTVQYLLSYLQFLF